MATPPYDHKYLITKEIPDLEKIKLVLEIEAIQHSKKEKEEISKKWWNKENIKLTVVIVLTGLISFVSTLVANFFKSSDEVDFKFKEANAKDFFNLKMEYFDGDEQKKESISHQIASFEIYEDETIHEIIKKGKVTFDSLYLLHKTKNAGSQFIDNKQNEKSTEANDELKKIDSLTNAKNQSNSASERKAKEKQIEERIDNFKKDNPEISPLINSTEDVQKSIEKIIQITNEENLNSISPLGSFRPSNNVFWFKEGYFLPLENDKIRIYLDEGKLNKKNGYIEVRICDGSGKNCFNDGRYLSVFLNGQGGEFEFKNKKYKINLRAIDRAGKNPFNWAAYITFDEWIE